ncbi:MAG: pyridoxamine 5'-phosphate oxidase family protein [Phycisphaerales bacterium]|nr:pyridoxamine 5'-phosphate oxidase family protein [Phycisphaerales bacterium]
MGRKLVDAPEITAHAWGLLSRGADSPDCAMHLLTLSTVTADRMPAARLMVNRGADRVSGRLWFHADAESPKVAELRTSPYACVVGYDPSEGIELRVMGSAVVHTRGHVADRHWGQFANIATWMIGSPEARPSGPYATDLRLPPDPDKLMHGLTARSRERFAVVEVVAETIDWLQAAGSDQKRAVLRRSGHWRAEVVG